MTADEANQPFALLSQALQIAGPTIDRVAAWRRETGIKPPTPSDDFPATAADVAAVRRAAELVAQAVPDDFLGTAARLRTRAEVWESKLAPETPT